MIRGARVKTWPSEDGTGFDQTTRIARLEYTNTTTAIFKIFDLPDLLVMIATFLTVDSIFAFAMINKSCYLATRLCGISLQSKATAFCESKALLKWAIANGCTSLPPCRWTSVTCLYAANNGRLEVLSWLRQQTPPCPWTESCFWTAASNGHLNILQFLRAQTPPCPWSVNICRLAAGKGHLHVLQWLRAQDPPCPWDEHSCRMAALNGHLLVLEWLRCQPTPCPWSKYTCAAAAMQGHLQILQWLRNQTPPCPWSAETCLVAIQGGHTRVLEWIQSKMNSPCPINALSSCRDIVLEVDNG